MLVFATISSPEAAHLANRAVCEPFRHRSPARLPQPGSLRLQPYAPRTPPCTALQEAALEKLRAGENRAVEHVALEDDDVVDLLLTQRQQQQQKRGSSKVGSHVARPRFLGGAGYIRQWPVPRMAGANAYSLPLMRPFLLHTVVRGLGPSGHPVHVRAAANVPRGSKLSPAPAYLHACLSTASYRTSSTLHCPTVQGLAARRQVAGRRRTRSQQQQEEQEPEHSQ